MGRHLNAGAEDDPRMLDIPTIGLFALVTLAALIGVPLFGYIYGYAELDWTMAGILYLISGLGITVGYHRMVSHRSFRAPRLGQGGVSGRGRLGDGELGAEMGRQSCSAPCARGPGGGSLQCDERILVQPLWLALHETIAPDRTIRARAVRGSCGDVATPLVCPAPSVRVGAAVSCRLRLNGWIGGVSCFMLAGVGRIFLVLNSTFCINSVCHLWGSQPYSRSNSSRDSWWVSLITLGEGYHNYHHTFPRDYRNGPLWYNVDPSKWLIYGLSKLGLAEGLV